MRVVFMGTPEFAVPALHGLLDSGYNTVAVFTQPDRPAGRGQEVIASPVKQAAQARGLPLFQPERIRQAENLSRVRQLAPDLTIVVAFGQILPEELLRIPRYGSINVHASLLPKYRGAAPIQHAIWRGERETGVSIMQMDAGMDTGPVWAQRSTEIGPEETSEELQSRLAHTGVQLLLETIPGIVSGGLTLQPQDHRRATMAPRLRKQDGALHWTLPAQCLHNQIRALNPWPGCFARLRGVATAIWRSRVVGGWPLAVGRESERGTIVALSREGAAVCCGDSTVLSLTELQWPGRKRLNAWDFANGLGLKTGERFSSP